MDKSGLNELIERPVQDVSLDFFEELGDGDILFIDSTHVLKIGSDVQYEYLEILPRLNHGVVVHVHDIFIPGEYPREWIDRSRFFWNEQYILQAFLAFNREYEVIWPGRFLQLFHADALRSAFPAFASSPKTHSSFWLQRTKQEQSACIAGT